jgi:hypothetical protein
MDGSGCFPSNQTIADESGLSRRCVIEHVDKAEKAGFLAIDARQRDNGSASSNLYSPTMPGSEPAALGSEPASPGDGDPAAPLLTTQSSNTPKEKPPTPKGAEVMDGDFFDFWNAYPNKVGRPKAFRAWLSVTKTHGAKFIIEGVERWCKARIGKRKAGGSSHIPRPEPAELLERLRHSVPSRKPKQWR